MTKTDSEEKNPAGKRRLGTARKRSGGGRLITENERAYGSPARLGRENDLSDREILDGMVADSRSDGWYVNGKRLGAAFRGPVDLSPSLVRDIHLYVCRVIRTKKKTSSIPAYHPAKNGIFSETVIGSEYSKIEASLRAGLPAVRTKYSEHVQLFLDGYLEFGLDGGVGNPDVISKYVGSSRQHQIAINGFVEWIRMKNVEKIEKPRPKLIYPDNAPKFQAVKSSGKRRSKKRMRSEVTGRFEIYNPMTYVPGAIFVAPSKKDQVIDDSFQSKLRRRRENLVRNFHKSEKLVERIFQRVESVRVFHLDVGIRPEHSGESHSLAINVVKDYLKVYFNYGVKNLGPFRGMLGRIAKLAYTRERGYFCRIMFIFESSPNANFVGLADRLGSFWVDAATEGCGVYATIGHGASRFRVEPKGAIRRFDPQARIALLRAVRYLTVTDEYLRPDLPARKISFFASDLPLWRDPPATKRGSDTIQDYVYKPSESPSVNENPPSSSKPPEDATSPDAPSTPQSAANVEADQSEVAEASPTAEAEEVRPAQMPMLFESEPQQAADNSPD